MTNIVRCKSSSAPGRLHRTLLWWFAVILGGSIASTFSGAVLAAPRIDVGVHELLPDTPNQVVTLQIDMAEEAVRGMNVRAQLGDGLGPLTEPIFTGADFGTSIWSGYPTVTLGGPVESAEQFLQSSVNFTDTGVSVVPNGVAVHLLISTVGIADGTYDLSLQSETIGEDTDLIFPGGHSMIPQLIDGQVRIVPEPGSGCSCLIGLFGLIFSRRRVS